jgi:hypothetical protein
MIVITQSLYRQIKLPIHTCTSNGDVIDSTFFDFRLRTYQQCTIVGLRKHGHANL